MFVSFFETCVLECFILKSNQMLFVISVLDFLSAPCKIYAKYYLCILCNIINLYPVEIGGSKAKHPGLLALLI